MLIVLISLIVLVLCFYKYEYAFLIFVFLYMTYPKVFAIGIGKEGFAFTCERAIAIILLGFIILMIFMKAKQMNFLYKVASKNKTLVWLIVLLNLWKIGVTLILKPFDLSSMVGLFDDFLFSFVIFCAAILALRSEKNIDNVFILILASLLLNNLVGVYEIFANRSILSDVQIDYDRVSDKELERFRSGEFRVPGLATNPLHLTFFICLCIPILVYYYKRTSVNFYKALLLIFGILSVIILYFTRSRSGLMIFVFAIGISTLLTTIFKVKTRNNARILLFNGIIVFASIAFLMISSALFEFVSYNLTGEYTSLDDDKSAVARLAQVDAVSELLSGSNLMVGYGRSRNLESEFDELEDSNMDNFFLRLSIESGIIGLLILIFLILFSLQLAQSLFKYYSPSSSINLKIRAIFIVIIVFIFIFILSSNPILHMFYYLMLSVLAVLNYNAKSKSLIS